MFDKTRRDNDGPPGAPITAPPRRAGPGSLSPPDRPPEEDGRLGHPRAGARHGARHLGRFRFRAGSLGGGPRLTHEPRRRAGSKAFGPLRDESQPELGRPRSDRGRVQRARATPPDASVMILPQVHLRKPCYDFYFLSTIQFDPLPGKQALLPAETGFRVVASPRTSLHRSIGSSDGRCVQRAGT